MDIGLVHTNLIYGRGAEKQICELSYYLNKWGNDVSLYVFEKKDNYVFDDLLENVNIVSLNKPWHIDTNNFIVSSFNIPRWYKMVKDLSNLIGNHDILNVQNTPSNWIGNFKDSKIVWSCLEPPYLTQADNSYKKYFIYPYRKLDNKLTKVDLICVNDDRMKGIVQDMFPNNSIVTIGSGSSLYRQVTHRNNDYINILSVGPIVYQRHQYDIVKAVSLLNFSNICIHFVGSIKDEEYYKKIVNLVNENNMNVIFHGFLSDDELYNLFDIADLAIMASIQPWGIFPLESFMANIPTITSNQVGINEFINNKDFIFEMGNVIDLSLKISEILTNYDSFKKKTFKISEEIYNKYSWESYSKRFFNVLKKTVEND